MRRAVRGEAEYVKKEKRDSQELRIVLHYNPRLPSFKDLYTHYIQIHTDKHITWPPLGRESGALSQ